MNSKSDYIKLIQNESATVKIDHDLFIAICECESAWNKDALRYEKSFDYLVNPSKFAALNKISVDTEIALQRMSYGLCQIMGGCLRDSILGYDKYLINLLDPNVNIKFGMLFFKKRCDIHEDVKDKISSWNMGSPAKNETGIYINHEYVDRVFSCYEQRKQCTSDGL